MRRGIFITVEGIEGSGKSTVINFIKSFLRKEGFSVITFRDPGSTSLGEKIRKILLDKKSNISPFTELLLYLAARTQLIEEKLKKALAEYDFVVSDRFYDSTLVYQGYLLEEKILKKAVEMFSLGIKPHLTIILDVAVKKGLIRLKGTRDRMESRPLKFHYYLRRGYLKLAKREPQRIKIVKSQCHLKHLYERVEEILNSLIKEWKK